MGAINVAAVWTGDAYDSEYVSKLHNMVVENGKGWNIRFLLYTDRPQEVPDPHNWVIIPIEKPFRSWWDKMQVFNPEPRGHRPTVYFDLDTVIVGNLRPLFNLAVHNLFGICANFTKRSGQFQYPCGYGSCCMTIAPEWGNGLYLTFNEKPDYIIGQAGRYGDQWAIEQFYPQGKLLQDELPTGFFVGRREFTETLPPNAAVMVFAGRHKPHNTDLPWIKEHWK